MDNRRTDVVEFNADSARGAINCRLDDDAFHEQHCPALRSLGHRQWPVHRDTSGQRAWPGFGHVHLELQRGRDMNAVEDLLPKIAGCFQ
jgi:hypothetical protein